MQSSNDAGLQAPLSPQTVLVLTAPQVHSTVVPEMAGSDTLEGEQVAPDWVGGELMQGTTSHARVTRAGLQSPVLTSHTVELVRGGSVGVPQAYSHREAPSPGGMHCLTA